MKRTISCFTITGIPAIKEQILFWINQFSICSFLDNHQYSTPYHHIECLAAAGAIRVFEGPNTLQAIDAFYTKEADWLFGHLAYNQQSNPIGFSPVTFFQPETVLRLSNTTLWIETIHASAENIFEQIIAQPIPSNEQAMPIAMQPKIGRAAYLATVHLLKQHIQRGDCYEINFCQEFFAENSNINPVQSYLGLTGISPTPFACYYKQQNAHLLCASPERYLQRRGMQLISQPIKGTNKRNTTNALLDDELKEALKQSSKDQSENVMVVDLVRNDLSRICKEGTVRVAELFGIYSFPQVHQMISTVTGELKPNTLFTEIIEASFPMGSMTGAPKKKVMELIEQYEMNPRGIYSGAVGYIDPQQNFDFNVVIRSLMYNADNKYLSYWVGSGITFYSNPEDEYEECLLKASAMNTILNQ